MDASRIVSSGNGAARSALIGGIDVLVSLRPSADCAEGDDAAATDLASFQLARTDGRIDERPAHATQVGGFAGAETRQLRVRGGRGGGRCNACSRGQQVGTVLFRHVCNSEVAADMLFRP